MANIFTRERDSATGMKLYRCHVCNGSGKLWHPPDVPERANVEGAQTPHAKRNPDETWKCERCKGTGQLWAPKEAG